MIPIGGWRVAIRNLADGAILKGAAQFTNQACLIVMLGRQYIHNVIPSASLRVQNQLSVALERVQPITKLSLERVLTRGFAICLLPERVEARGRCPSISHVTAWCKLRSCFKTD